MRRWRPIDRTIDSKVQEIVPEAQLYTKLASAEKWLDAAVSRKYADMQERVRSMSKHKRTLRIFVSNLAHDQPWQGSLQHLDPNAFDFESNYIPSWTLRMEGKLLENDQAYSIDGNEHSRQPTGPKHGTKFSAFLRSITVEIDRPSDLYAEPNVVEWNRLSTPSSFDGFEVRRKGDTNVNVKILIRKEHNPERYKLTPKLANLIGITEDTKQNIVLAFWRYIKHFKLQDSQDKRLINCDTPLQEALDGEQQFNFARFPTMLNRYLEAPDPLEINYIVRVDQEFTQSDVAWDIEVNDDDQSKDYVMATLQSLSSQKDVSAYDNEITSLIQKIKGAYSRYDFYSQLAEDPVPFLDKWLASQNRDINLLVGDSNVSMEDQRNSEFYRQDWINESVFHYLARGFV